MIPMMFLFTQQYLVLNSIPLSPLLQIDSNNVPQIVKCELTETVFKKNKIHWNRSYVYATDREQFLQL